jgi:flagellar biosynthesis protein FlhG
VTDPTPSTPARIIAVGGGKGGVGRTLLASGLAVFIASIGKKVLLVDGHPHRAPLGAIFGVARSSPHAAPWAPHASGERGHETVVANVRLLEGAAGRGPPPGRRRMREIAARCGADLCVVDLGPGVSARTLDVMLDADAAITVATPEPEAVEEVYRFLRHAFAHRLMRRLRAMGHDAGVARLRTMLRAAGAAPLPVEIAEALSRAEPDLARVVWGEFANGRVRLVMNESRARADLELGEAMVRVAQRPLGPTLEYLGAVEFDDAVFLAARRRRPVLLDAPSAKASRNLERVARRLLSVEGGRLLANASPLAAMGPVPPPTPALSSAPPAPTHYEVLALDRGASDEEIRRAYRKTREIFAVESIALAGVHTDEEVARMVARVEEARDVLLDPARRRPYDLSITPFDAVQRPMPLAAELADDVPLPGLAEPELSPDTEYTGALLKAVREARGVELRGVAARTKISLQYLRAIEDEDFRALPAAVYTRGFVVEVAKYLRLDVEQVVRTYLRRYRKATET